MPASPTTTNFPNGISFVRSNPNGSNTLSNYETGTFTPRFGAVTATYTTQTGRYERIGNIVYVEVDFVLSSLDTADTSDSNITDLPFPIAETGYLLSGIDLVGSTLITPADNISLSYQSISSTVVSLTDEAGTAITYNSGIYNASGIYRVTLTYRTDA